MISSSVLRHLCRSVATSVRTHWGLSHVNRFTVREHNCGDITEKMIGKRVTVYGWIKSRRKEGKKIGFIVLSDAYGSVQLLSVNRNWEVPNRGSVVMATGLVQKRPEKDVNPKMTSGSVEILLDDIKLLGSNENISSLEWSDDEPLRMRNRYVDLRTEEMQRNLRLKSLLLTSVRNFLVQEGFVEIETPVLQKITPGGAHEFVVPTQIEDHYYCLGQSPQLYKQLLMVGGCDRYFQIAKCFRNETARADRQPEFQQIDVELSFTTRDGILDLIENLIVSVWPAFLDKVSIPFPRIQYKEAMTLYGSDKPDLRSKIELKTIEIQSEKQTNLSLITLVIPNGANEKHAANLKELGSKAATKVYYKGNLIGSCSNDDSCSFETEPSLMLSSQVKDHLRQSLHLNQSDYLFIAHGDDKLQRKVMGTLRNMCVNYMVESKMIQSEFGAHNFLWVIDFPMFLINETTGQIECGHHPFSAPKPEHLDKVYSSPLEVESDQFDLVLNGEEIGGGSMRITCPKLQKYVFENILKADPHSMEFFIRALSSGCPPHGGLAIGVDRLLKIISKADSIRDFIAFPKSMNCRDHLSSAPNPLTDELKSTYHLK